MGDYEVGYGKPPKHTRFKKGVCPNPRGRGKKRDHQLGDIVLKVLGAKTEFRERGLIKQGSRMELAIRRHFAAALNGDVASSALLLKIRRHAEKYSDPGPLIVNIINTPERQCHAASDLRSPWWPGSQRG
ncbi:MAG: DUF5681 domain-containing protein [Roseiarcus sp.]